MFATLKTAWSRWTTMHPAVLPAALVFAGLATAVLAVTTRDDPAPPPTSNKYDSIKNNSTKNKPAGAPAAAANNAALVVEVVRPRAAQVAESITATGNIAPWQEAIVGAEVNGLRLSRVLVNVGSVVKAGDVLAEFDSEGLSAETAQMRANVAEAEAAANEATLNAQRARQLKDTGALSAQQIGQFTTAEATALARVEGLRAAARVQALRLKNTRVRAPDDGIVASRSATQGAVMGAGQEMFRLIRKGRLEWRAEVTAADMGRLKPGMPVSLLPNGSGPVSGVLREVAPTVDPTTRNGLVYVDLPAQASSGAGPGASVRAGMFARGEFKLGSGSVMTLPQSAVLLRDGFSYVFTVGADGRVAQLKVGTGRREGERVEVTSGLTEGVRVVASGGGFLVDGDTVRIVDAPAVKPAVAAK